ncbi:MAG TPA: hypothetical protein VFO18_07635 [Methylomirabilota bacterium]|nr:hypothetical protein [Methylomirabilota bacterium]
MPLTIQLRPAEGHRIESKAFFPLEIFARGTHVFLDCRSYPEGEDCTLRLDQIVGAQCEVVSGASETADSWKSRNWSQAAGRYRAWERPPSPKRRGVDRGLRLRLSAYLAAGGTTLGWLILFRRALGY